MSKTLVEPQKMNGGPTSTFTTTDDVYVTKDGYHNDVTTDDASSSQDTMWSEDSSYNSDNCVHRLQMWLSSFTTKHSTSLRNLVLFAMLVAYLIYFGFAIAYDAKLADSLIVITLIVLAIIIYTIIRDQYGEAIYTNCMQPCWQPIAKRWHIIQW